MSELTLVTPNVLLVFGGDVSKSEESEVREGESYDDATRLTTVCTSTGAVHS